MVLKLLSLLIGIGGIVFGTWLMIRSGKSTLPDLQDTDSRNGCLVGLAGIVVVAVAINWLMQGG